MLPTMRAGPRNSATLASGSALPQSLKQGALEDPGKILFGKSSHLGRVQALALPGIGPGGLGGPGGEGRGQSPSGGWGSSCEHMTLNTVLNPGRPGELRGRSSLQEQRSHRQSPGPGTCKHLPFQRKMLPGASPLSCCHPAHREKATFGGETSSSPTSTLQPSFSTGLGSD